MALKPRISILAASLFALLCAAPAHAFIFIRAGVYANKGERPVSRAPLWTSRTATFKINTDQTAYGGSIAPELTAGEFTSAVQTALNAWASICDSDVSVTYGGTSANTKSAGDSVNTITWDNRTTAEGNGIASAGTLAVAYSAVGVATDLYSDCDIVVNGEALGNFGINGEAAKYDLISTLVHEIGHCVGLDHTVESPTWTASNAILLNSPMKSAVSAGDITGRSISQDEIDAMECVNPTGGSSRAGSRCSSYHGTSGNGGLSGTVSGGPERTLTCGEGTGASAVASTSNESGSGCITEAIGADGSPARRGSLAGSWMTELLAMCAAYLVYRLAQRLRRRATTASLIVLILGAGAGFVPSDAHAFSLEVGAENRWMNPVLLNHMAELTTNEGTFVKIDPKENYNQAYDTAGRMFFDMFRGMLQLGVFARSLSDGERTQAGYDSAGRVSVTKTTKLSGFSAGPIARASSPVLFKGISLFIEALLGVGKIKLDQEIVEYSGANSTLSASASSIEAALSVGADYEIASFFHVRLQAGYSRYKTNFFALDSKTGSRYSALTEGKRIGVSDGGTVKDLVADRSGVTAGLAFMFSL